MGATENFELLKTLVSDCIDENERIWNKPYDPSDKKQIIYRLNFYYDNIKVLEEVAGDLIEFCKDFIEDSPKKNYEFYRTEVFHNLNKVLDGKGQATQWYGPNKLLLWYYDKVKIYERQERNGDCVYVWDKECQLWQKPKGSDMFYLMSNYQDQNHALYEYCRLRESFEYRLLSLLCHYKENNNGNVNTDYEAQLFLFAHTICLYTAMHNEIKLLLKDAKYAGVKLEELNDSTTTNNNGTKKIKNQCDEEHHPSVFISYSSGDEKHDAWVLQLADDLTKNGVIVHFDKYDLRSGKLTTGYMENSIQKADRTLVIGTPEYKIRAEGKKRGVGFEYTIISVEIMSEVGTERFIPILRIGTWKESFPPLISGRMGFDMTDDSKYNKTLTDLLREIYDEPKIVRPPLGKKPDWGE